MAQKRIRHNQVDAGLGPNQIVKLDDLGRLPPIDGSQLTGVSGGDVVSDLTPQLGGNLDLNSFNLFTEAVGSPASASTESFNFTGGNNSAGGGTFTAGGATIQGGTGSNGNDGGPIVINGGSSADGGYGGYVSISSGSGTLTSGAGTISITGGNSSNSAFGGGSVNITSGDNLAATGAAAAGDIDLTAGDSTTSTSGVGGNINLYAGAGGDTGGDIILQPGIGAGGIHGIIQLNGGLTITTDTINTDSGKFLSNVPVPSGSPQSGPSPYRFTTSTDIKNAIDGTKYASFLDVNGQGITITKNTGVYDGKSVVFQVEGYDDVFSALGFKSNSILGMIFFTNASETNKLGFLPETNSIASSASTINFGVNSGGQSVFTGSASGIYPITPGKLLGLDNDDNAWSGLYLNGIIKSRSLTGLPFASMVTDGASAIAYEFDTINNLNTVGAKLLSLKNNNVEKLYIDKDGGINGVILTDGGSATNFLNEQGDYVTVSSPSALNDLTDVIVAGSPLVSGQVLKFNGTNWINDTDSGLFVEDGNNNIVGGTLAGASLIAGSLRNFFAGYQAGNGVTTGDDNIAIGQYAGRTIITGSRNISIGSTTLANGTGGAKSDNIAIGNSALSQLSADSIDNVAIGSSAGVSITGGSRNVMIGNSAGPTTNQSDQLFINNDQSDTPLIHGNFSTGGSPAAAGDVTINGQLLIEDGVGSAPGIAFSTTPNMGIYRQSSSIMSLVTNGQLRLDIGTSLHSRVQHNFNSGSAASPTIVHLNDNGTGIYFVNPDEVHIATGSTDRLGIMSDGSLTVAGTTNYELLVTDDDDIPNKKYVDDAVITGGGSTKPQYESITLAGSPPSEIINTTVPTVAIGGSPQLAGVQVFRNGMLQDEGVDVGSPATITDDFVVSGPNQITFAPGILKAGGKINIFAFV